MYFLSRVIATYHHSVPTFLRTLLQEVLYENTTTKYQNLQPQFSLRDFRMLVVADAHSIWHRMDP